MTAESAQTPVSPPIEQVSPPIEQTDTLIGTTLNGKYTILSPIASGGMGRIYRAEQIPLGRLVALKVLHTQFSSRPDHAGFQKRFLREANILAKLQHPNIVTVFDYGKIEKPHQEEERFFMAMEFLKGETLQKKLLTRGYLSVEETLNIAQEIGRGLCEAHSLEVVHRDLKPSNIMLCPERDGRELIKILDFGIGKMLNEDPLEADLTQEGFFLGSPHYMAPEQIGNGTIDARTDIYSLGMILYQCLSGKRPFQGETSVQMIMSHLHQPPIPLRERAPDLNIPEWLELLVMRCLEKDPNKRFANAERLLQVIDEQSPAISSLRFPALHAHSSGHTTQTATSIPTFTFRKPVLTTFFVVGGISLLGGGIFLFLFRAFFFRPATPIAVSEHHHPPPPPPIPPSRSSFSFGVESTPTGAEVIENDKVIGTTPLQIILDNQTIRSMPIRFIVRKQGYEPYVIVQGPSEENVRIIAPLTPISENIAPPPKSTSNPVNRIPVKTNYPLQQPNTNHTPHNHPSNPPSNLDIRLER
ncbi:serine/threonine protein kinase [Pajaroellobacter abortibovis]|uniref:Protein kinase domain-containing protein n=1 Tax=Pajaroellobacter abortibovis TaxID=1882918 RepID=A0A1L6MXI8_9BACT|nr:serine/threonine-protein kinase [Pajaroellobacter abortibovis]APS00244.1 hypothetical protein BCY86_05765 [Pajaroellobacter abortibovis]